ncbi:hypothetical protein [uncultured Roseobacter sp.]|uniref:hypothetical protein n=1 Tax=uncultured Roseobacter sp. TaxID=114847 RepID=UPI002632088A|nr:hypothetical protein [uncultured Roseobacter sp.]
MHQNRRPAHEVTPASEDAGLFQNAISSLVVELVPQTRRNDRGDLIIRGFVNSKYDVDVFFAGRRAKEAAPIERHLKTLLSRARTAARAEGIAQTDTDRVRWPIRVEGAWRRRVQRDEWGWETGTYHLVVSRWSIVDDNGVTNVFGAPPIIRAPSEGPD